MSELISAAGTVFEIVKSLVYGVHRSGGNDRTLRRILADTRLCDRIGRFIVAQTELAHAIDLPQSHREVSILLEKARVTVEDSYLLQPGCGFFHILPYPHVLGGEGSGTNEGTLELKRRDAGRAMAEIASRGLLPASIHQLLTFFALMRTTLLGTRSCGALYALGTRIEPRPNEPLFPCIEWDSRGARLSMVEGYHIPPDGHALVVVP